jgi:putative transposase
LKLVAQVKLLTTQEQSDLLLATVRSCNAACNWISAEAWSTGTFRQYDIHYATYYTVRRNFGLASQMTVRCIAKVADAYKLDRKKQRDFRDVGSVEYDTRLLSWRDDAVSLWTLSGRQTIKIACGDHQRLLLEGRTCTADLCLVRGQWYLNVVCNVAETAPSEPIGFLGVDLGLANLATTSDGECFSGADVETVRKKRHRTRRSMGRRTNRVYKRSTRRNARRALRRLGNREQRFRKHVNHCISKRIVALAEGTKRGIALEDLKGIRERTRFRKDQRAKVGGWAFHQLRTFVVYKSQLHGVPVVVVDPRNTSRTCSQCGHCEKGNRQSQDRFKCLACGYEAHADINAAVNIAAAGAVVSQPEGSERQSLSTAT